MDEVVFDEGFDAVSDGFCRIEHCEGVGDVQLGCVDGKGFILIYYS
jgi:hypothetical protein